MSLRGSCTICTDFFDSSSEISATPCGHIFHAACINQWFITSKFKTNGTCPQCRSKFPIKNLIKKLFINIQEHNGDDDGDGGVDTGALKNKLNESLALLSTLKAEKSKLADALAVLEKSKDDMKSKNKRLKNDLAKEKNMAALIKQDMNILQEEVKEARAAKKLSRELEQRLATLTDIETVLNGQKADVDDMVKMYNCDKSSNACRQLAIHCVALKQEYENVKVAKSRLNTEVMRAKRDLHRKDELLIKRSNLIESMDLTNKSLVKNEESLNNELKSLRHKVKALQSAIESPNDTKSSAVARLIAESPAPEFLTPIQNIRTKRKTDIKGDGPIPIKSPRLSVSFDLFEPNEEDVDVVNLDSGTTKSKSEDENLPTSSSSCDTPTTSKMKQQCSDLGIEYKKPTIEPIRKQQQVKKPSLQHLNKYSGYNGMGGHTKITMLISSFKTPKALKPTFKFSSSNTVKFTAAAASSSTARMNRFSKLKRVGPK